MPPAMRTKQVVSLSLTPGTLERVDRLASWLGISRSDCVERILFFRTPLLTDPLPNDIAALNGEAPERQREAA